LLNSDEKKLVVTIFGYLSVSLSHSKNKKVKQYIRKNTTNPIS